MATAFAEHFNSMHVKEYWMRNFFNFLGVDGATHIAVFPSEVNDAVEVIKSKPIKAAFSTKLADIKALARNTVRKFDWF